MENLENLLNEVKEALNNVNDIQTLNDIKGMPMVKSAAESIVKKIKDGIGTKGYVIYHADGGGIGGGRRHTAEAIAGEAQIPMIVINAQDFAIKDIDALSQQANL